MTAYSPAFLKVLAEVEKNYGPILRQSTGKTDLRRIPTGIFQLDRVLGGGFPLNRLNLIGGHKGSFKTTIALKAVKSYLERCPVCLTPLAEEKSEGRRKKSETGQERSDLHPSPFTLQPCACLTPEPMPQSICLYIAIEHLEESYIANLGLDPARVYVLQPPHGEAACEYAEKFAKVPEVGAMVIDSLGALASESELEKGYFDSVSRGLRARLIARMTRALITHIDRPENGNFHCGKGFSRPRLVLMLNHLLPRMDGKMAVGDYLPGGETQKYLSAVVVKVWTTGKGKGRVNLKGTEAEEDEDDKAKGRKGEEEPQAARKQGLGFLLEYSRVSPDNIAGECEIFLESRPEQGILYGDPNDWPLMLEWLSKLGWLEHSGKTWELEGQKYPSQKAIVEGWKKDRTTFAALRARVLAATLER